MKTASGDYNPRDLVRRTHIDYGPDSDEETRLKEELRQLHERYKKEAQPIIDRLTLLAALKVPKIWIEK